MRDGRRERAPILRKSPVNFAQSSELVSRTIFLFKPNPVPESSPSKQTHSPAGNEIGSSKAGDDVSDLVRVEGLEGRVVLGRCGAHFEELVAYARTAVLAYTWGPVSQSRSVVGGPLVDFTRIDVDSVA